VFDEDPAIKDYLNVRISTIKVTNAQGNSESMQMMVVPDGAKLSDYVFTPDTQGVPVTLTNTGILLTENAASELLHVGQGDKVSLQNPKLDQGDTTVAHVVRYYLGNYVYVSQSLYESMFGAYMPNAALAHLDDTVTDQAAFAKALPDQHDFIQTAVSTEAMRADFATNFTMLNAVIVLLIVMAGGLAFVVLFTLSNTNISERERELATIKVLGFYDMEVHSYVNKETVILTGIGALLGLPVGYFFSGLIISTLSIPAVQFQLSAQPLSYVYSAVISFGFGLIVSIITNRTLDRINMVEALKSIE
jgi:putative ABC transport system permease protein